MSLLPLVLLSLLATIQVHKVLPLIRLPTLHAKMAIDYIKGDALLALRMLLGMEQTVSETSL